MKLKQSILLSTTSLVISILLSKVFRFSLVNTWQACIALFFVFSPLWLYGWKFSSDKRDAYPFLCFFIKFAMLIWLVGYVITMLVVLIAGW